MQRCKLHVGLITLLLACASPPRVAPLVPGSLASADAEDDRELAPYTIAPQPEWGDRYAHTDLRSDVRFFRIKKLMTDLGLPRMAAAAIFQPTPRRARVPSLPRPRARGSLVRFPGCIRCRQDARRSHRYWLSTSRSC